MRYEDLWHALRVHDCPFFSSFVAGTASTLAAHRETLVCQSAPQGTSSYATDCQDSTDRDRQAKQKKTFFVTRWRYFDVCMCVEYSYEMSEMRFGSCCFCTTTVLVRWVILEQKGDSIAQWMILTRFEFFIRERICLVLLWGIQNAYRYRF